MTLDKKNPYKCFPFEKVKDGRQFSPSAARNAAPILEVLKTCLPESGTILEVAAGTGEHSVLFAPEFPELFWLATDPAQDKIESIRAWHLFKPSPNLLAPITLDAAAKTWPVEKTDLPAPITGIVCINLIHVSPWRAGQGLLAAAGRILGSGGILYLYGAYKMAGQHTAPSNEEFDVMLRRTDAEWGLRSLEDVEAEANKDHLKLINVVPMPANNFSVVFQKI